jgi:folylpolyglutamate synthase/dihydropteroate synthase
MLSTLLPLCERAWFTAPPSTRALSPAALQSLARQLGFDATVCEPRPSRALEQARSWAREHAGAVLVTGSVYLVGELLGEFASAGEREPADSPPASTGAARGTGSSSG